jgi:hypothetical protein
MSWIIAVVLVLVLIALIRSFIMNARLIMRDMNNRFDGLRTRLEHEANSIVGEVLETHRTDLDGRP